MTGEVLVVGLGNDFRGDDAVGPVVARAAAAHLDTPRRPVAVLAGIADPLDLLGRWDDAALVVIVDAVRSGAPAGRVSVIDVADPRHGPEADDTTATVAACGAGPDEHPRGRDGRHHPPRPRPRPCPTPGRPRHRGGRGLLRCGDTLSAAVAAAVPEAVTRVLEAVGATAPGVSPGRVPQR